MGAHKEEQPEDWYFEVAESYERLAERHQESFSDHRKYSEKARLWREHAEKIKARTQRRKD